MRTTNVFHKKSIKQLALLMLGIALMLTLTFALASCGDDKSTDSNQGNTPTDTTTDTEPKKIEGITFKNSIFTYDGNEHSVLIDGILPEGVNVAYSGNTATAAGSYTATATLSGEGYEPLILTATLTVKKATITGITFPGDTYSYDGNEHSVLIVGNLPEGVNASYSGNTATFPGSYNASVTLSGDNYETLSLTAAFRIEKGEIGGLKFKSDTATYDGQQHTILINGTLPEGVNVTYKNNSATDAGTYAATATISGDYYNTLTLNAVLTINEAEITGIEFPKVIVTYDGKEHTALIKGTLPDGVNVSYSDNSATDAGTYTAAATLSGKNYKTKTLYTPLIINPMDISGSEIISGIKFDDLTVTYDGKQHTILIDGTLPEGVSVTYINNSATDADVYDAVAILSGDNYITATLNAKLTINKADIDISSLDFSDTELTYDGKEHTLTVSGTLPDGVGVDYISNSGTNAGTYNAIATLGGKNYNAAEMRATLTIKKASLKGIITLNDKTFTYSENTKRYLSVSGTLPEGVSVTYQNNDGKFAVGKYTITATISGDNYETLTLTATLEIKQSNSTGGTLTPEHPF